MKATKRSYRLYAAWEYEKEEADLNASSKEGWQLVKGGCFSSTFRKDEGVRSIYQLDYRPRITDMDRYKEVFEEQGWTYISSTFNGWHYFCKPYKEGESAEDYKIYTDKESLHEMQNRWIGIATTLFFIYLVLTGSYIIHFIRSRETSWLIEAIAFMLLTVIFGWGVQSLKRSRKGLKNSTRMPVKMILPLAVVLLISGINMQGTKSHNLIYHTNFTFINKPENELPKLSPAIVIEKKGEYKVDLEMITSDGQIQVVMQDSNGNKVFDVTADKCTINNYKIILEAGTYAIHFNYLTGSYPIDESERSINMKLKK
jgi:uncharacterized membrane protein SirB2